MPLEIEITPSPLQKISAKKKKHTQGKNYCIFSATFKKVLNLYVRCFFSWHSALTTFVASTTNDVSKAKRQSRDTTRMLSTEEGEGVDFRIRTSSDHSFFWARYEHFIDKVTRRFFFSSIFYFLQSDISFAWCLGELMFLFMRGR